MAIGGLSDGLIELQRHLDAREIMRVIELTAKWVDPKTFKLLPLWYPEYARRAPLCNKDWTIRRTNTRKGTDVALDKEEGNSQANKALTYALGLSKSQRTHWSCCHVWGVDDASYASTNSVVQDRRFFSCVANMVLLPSPMKAFTDVMPEVKAMLRICAMNLYGWHCDHENLKMTVEALRDWNGWDAYPKSWPRTFSDSPPPGVLPLNDRIRGNAERRIQKIKFDLENAGDLYPRKEVRDALQYWNMAL